jgi:hypothetical protein
MLPLPGPFLFLFSFSVASDRTRRQQETCVLFFCFSDALSKGSLAQRASDSDS